MSGSDKRPSRKLPGSFEIAIGTMLVTAALPAALAADRDGPTAPAEAKCCRKCAFRPGSRERRDPYTWMHLREGWDEGLSFVCHESVPGHPGEVVDGRPRMRICAGWQACSSTGRFPRATPGPEFVGGLA